MNIRFVLNVFVSVDIVLYLQIVVINQELVLDLVCDLKLNFRIDYVNNMLFVLGVGYFSEILNLVFLVFVGE